MDSTIAVYGVLHTWNRPFVSYNCWMDEHFFLRKDELLWVKYQPYLESSGYRLRPRYQPGWTAPWKGTDATPMLYEDCPASFVRSINLSTISFHLKGCSCKYPNLIEVRRIDDNFKVTLKRVLTWTEEIPIARYFLRGASIRSQKLYGSYLRCDTLTWRRRVGIAGDAFPTAIRPSPIPISSKMRRIFPEISPSKLEAFILKFAAKVLLQGLEFMHEHNVAHRWEYSRLSIISLMSCTEMHVMATSWWTQEG